MHLRGAGLEVVPAIQVRAGEDRAESRWQHILTSSFLPFQSCFPLSWLSVPEISRYLGLFHLETKPEVFKEG